MLPTTDLAPLLEAGAHVFPVKDKVPSQRKSWRNYHFKIGDKTPARSTHFAIVPASVNLAVIDMDSGNAQHVRNYLDSLDAPFVEAPSAQAGRAHFIVRCRAKLGNGKWALEAMTGGETRSAAGYVVMYDLEAWTRAIELPNDPDCAFAVEGLCEQRIAEGSRAITLNARGFGNPRHFRAHIAAAIADGLPTHEAKSVIARARVDGMLLQQLQSKVRFFGHDTSGALKVDVPRTALVWRALMDDYARLGVAPAHYIRDNGFWIVWNDGRYQRAHEAGEAPHAMQKLWSDLCHDLVLGRVIKEEERLELMELGTATHILKRLATYQNTTADALDSDPDIIGLPDGYAWDFKSEALLTPDPSRLVTLSTGVAPDFDMQIPRWLAFIEEAQPHQRERNWLRAMGKYTMTGHTNLELLAFLYGEPNRGKSTYAHALRKIMGEYAAVVNDDVLLAKRNAPHPEFMTSFAGGKRMALTTDIKHNARWDTAFVQQAVSGEPLRARHLYGHAFEFTPRAKLWLAGNDSPMAPGNAGIWRRLGVVGFNVQPQRPDPRLAEALEAELPGIMAWFLGGEIDLLRADIPESMRVRVQEQREGGDWLRDALPAVAEKDAGGWVAVTSLYEALHNSRQCPAYIRSSAALGRELKNNGYDMKRRTAGNGLLGWSLKGDVGIF